MTTKTTKTKKTKLATANKTATTQKVVIRRELLYIYPRGMTDPSKRKTYRAKIRNGLQKLESEISKLRGESRKEKKAELVAYREKYLTKP